MTSQERRIVVDSLEVRWFVPGPLGVAVGDWFGRFPAWTEARADLYLVWPQLDGLSVKLRDGGALDVKSYLGTSGILDVPAAGVGQLESWRKWSFPCAAPHPAGTMPQGWVTVRKARARRPAPWPPRAGMPRGN
jgi:hypothetical protein